MGTMRLTRLNARLPIAAALGAVIAASALVGTARAGDSNRPFDEQILHNILTGIGLQDPNAPQPTYEERPPLAIPKGDTLPPPGKAGATIAKNPAWPKDPDVLRAKALAKSDKNTDFLAEMERENNPLPPDQLGPKYPGHRTSRGSVADNSSSADLGEPHMMTPSQLGYHGGLFGNMFGSDDKSDETARFTGEPARTSLTEPPPGYQTPSPDQPYGLGKQSTTPKANNYYLTHSEMQN